MAQQNPPPYAEIDGLYVQIDKHVDVTLARYDGNARPGQLVVDTANYALYVGNASGLLTLINYGNTDVAAYLAVNTSNISAGNINSGNINSGNINSSNISAAGSISASGSITTNNIVSAHDINVSSTILSRNITGYSGTGTQVTVNYTTPAPINFVDGQPIIVSGFSDIVMNGTWILLSHTNTTATINIVGVSGSVPVQTGLITQTIPGGNITTDGTVICSKVSTIPTTVTGLVSPATAGAGARAFVSDSGNTVFGEIVTGGSFNIVPVWCNGTNWIVG